MEPLILKWNIHNVRFEISIKIEHIYWTIKSTQNVSETVRQSVSEGENHLYNIFAILRYEIDI